MRTLFFKPGHRRASFLAALHRPRLWGPNLTIRRDLCAQILFSSLARETGSAGAVIQLTRRYIFGLGAI